MNCLFLPFTKDYVWVEKISTCCIIYGLLLDHCILYVDSAANLPDRDFATRFKKYYVGIRCGTRERCFCLLNFKSQLY